MVDLEGRIAVARPLQIGNSDYDDARRFRLQTITFRSQLATRKSRPIA
jgi:hypothetical protein